MHSTPYSYEADTRRSLNIYNLPGLMGDMANELGGGGISPTIIGAQLVAFASLITQGTADVFWPNNQRTSIGANVLLVAPSGGGKSVIFKTLMEPVSYSLMKHRDINGETEQRPAFFIEDATRESTLEHLKEWPIAGLFTDEAGMIKRLIKSGASTLVKLLDGAVIHHSRVSTGRIALRGHRLSMLLLEQPQVFQETKALLGASTGGVGLINRFHFFTANSLPVGASLHRLVLSAQTLQRYSEKVFNLLGKTVQNVQAKQELPTLRLETEALDYFCHLRDEVQQRLASDARLNCIAEYASRHTERTLRLAACIHAFEYGSSSEINQSTVQIASSFDHESIEAYLQMVYEPPKITQNEQNAKRILDELRNVAGRSGTTEYQLSVLRKLAPNIGLTKAQFDRALPLLAEQGSVTVHHTRRGEFLYINHVYLPSIRY